MTDAHPAHRPGAFIDAFADVTLLIVGDVMLDRYWWGTVSRTSPEAPVPIVRKRRTTVAAGGAANVAANVASLGGRAQLIGLIGDDAAGRELREVLERSGVGGTHLVVTRERPTTVKTRIVAHQQHVVRVDEEETVPIGETDAARIVAQVEALLPGARALVLSDYAKGVLGPRVLGPLIQAGRAHGIPVLVDPKGLGYARYAGATTVCPNGAEAVLAAGLSGEDPDLVEHAGLVLLEQLPGTAIVITRGERGMSIFEPCRGVVHLATLAHHVFDVTGAGDSVMATLALALAAGADLVTAGVLANLAGGLAVEHVGTSTVTADRLREAARTRRSVVETIDADT